MIPATPALTATELSIGRYTLQGASRATAASYWRLKELDVLFDLGHCPQAFIGASRVFLTHCHLDHAMGIAYWGAQRQMMRMPKGVIYVPAGTEAGLARVLASWAALQGEHGHYNVDVIPLGDGDEVEIHRGVSVRAFKTIHSVPSLGYLVVERKEKLRAEFHGLTPAAVGELKRAGREVTEPFTRIAFGITGDTAALPFESVPELAAAETLVGECTYIAPEHAHLARPMSHLHLSDYGAVARDIRSERIVLTHYSLRYKEEEIPALVRAHVHDDLAARIIVV